jgi:hypothetical protein
MDKMANWCIGGCWFTLDAQIVKLMPNLQDVVILFYVQLPTFKFLRLKLGATMANNVVPSIVIKKYSFFKEATTLLIEKLLFIFIFSWKKMNLSILIAK